MRIVASDVHFAIVDLGGPAFLTRRHLLLRGVQVRDCASFGLPFHMRLSTRLPGQNERLFGLLRGLTDEEAPGAPPQLS